MLNKLEKVKILHLYAHYKINVRMALEKGNNELAKEYKIRLDTMKCVLDNLELEPWE
jgi:hypothetical protein